MREAYGVYILLLMLTSVVSIAMSYFSWKRRTAQGALSLSIFMLATAIWSGFQAATLIAADFEIKLILSKLRYIGIETAPIAFFGFAWNYTKRKNAFNWKQYIKALIFPAICFEALWRNWMHHRFFTRTYMENGMLILENGPIFWINMIYLYFFIAYSLVLLVRAYTNSLSKYRAQAAIIITGGAAAVLANLAYNFNLLPWGHVDITPISFLFSGLLFFYALFYYGLFDVVPIARDVLVEEMEDAFIVLDSQNRIMDMNRKARQLILKEDANTKDYIGIDIGLISEGWRELAAAILDDSSENIRINYISNSEVEYYDLNKKNIFDKEQNVTGKIVDLRKITRLQEALKEAKEAKEAAERASQVKGEFLANMSHEIRTPMNAVLNLAEMLGSDQLAPGDQKRYAQMIMDSAESLMTIINDILDLSKIEAGKLELNIKPFSLRQLVEGTVETFKMAASKSNITINLHINDEFPSSLLGDAARVRQILTNLLGNALKFTHRGSVDVFLKLISGSYSTYNIELTVADTGIGIPQNKLRTIFESFEQADGSTTRKYGGTGLGLSIVNSLVSLMKGTIDVKSELDHGSTFTITLPMEVAVQNQEEDGGRKYKAQGIEDVTGLKVLVAEDNKINREIMSLNLKKLGCQYDMVENGELVVEQYEKQDYDVILMDIHMPQMDGLEATQIIRAKERLTGRHIQIIALTASAMEEDIRKCIEAGMDAHVSKPIKFDKLKSTLANTKK